MAIGQIPPWLAPGDFLGAAQSGIKLGQQRDQIANEAAIAFARINAERQRIDQAAQESAMQGKVAQEKTERDFNLREQENAARDAYNLQKLGLEEKQLEQQAKTAADAIAERKAAADSLNTYRAGQLNLGERRLQQSANSPNTETVTEKFPAVEASPAIPGSPKGTGFLGTGLFAKDAVEAQPAIEAQPERTVSRKVPIPKSDESYESEADARSAGKKNGDVVIIKGVGKVRLK